MSKIPIISDSHFGARSDAKVFLDYFLDTYETILFPYCNEHQVKHIIHLGDFFDRRKYINFHTLSEVKRRFIEPLRDMNIKVHCLVGNHDTYYKNTNRINSLAELLYGYDNFMMYDQPQSINLYGLNFGMVSWINEENSEEMMEFISNCSAEYLCGHFELNGFDVFRGVQFKEGFDPKHLSKFDRVFSGHFHCKQSKDNILYVGTQYQITFSDLYEEKGIHVLDTESRELEFIPNPIQKFFKIDYDDSTDDVLNIDFSVFKDCYVKIHVVNKEKPFTFDKFLDKLYSANPANVSVIEPETMEFDSEDKLDLEKGTLDIIYEAVDTMEHVQDVDALKTLLRELYMESLSQ